MFFLNAQKYKKGEKIRLRIDESNTEYLIEVDPDGKNHFYRDFPVHGFKNSSSLTFFSVGNQIKFQSVQFFSAFIFQRVRLLVKNVIRHGGSDGAR